MDEQTDGMDGCVWRKQLNESGSLMSTKTPITKLMYMVSSLHDIQLAASSIPWLYEVNSNADILDLHKQPGDTLLTVKAGCEGRLYLVSRQDINPPTTFHSFLDKTSKQRRMVSNPEPKHMVHNVTKQLPYSWARQCPFGLSDIREQFLHFSHIYCSNRCFQDNVNLLSQPSPHTVQCCSRQLTGQFHCTCILLTCCDIATLHSNIFKTTQFWILYRTSSNLQIDLQRPY